MSKSDVSDVHFPHSGPCEEYSVRGDWELCLPAMLGQTDSLKARVTALEAALEEARTVAEKWRYEADKDSWKPPVNWKPPSPGQPLRSPW